MKLINYVTKENLRKVTIIKKGVRSITDIHGNSVENKVKLKTIPGINYNSKKEGVVWGKLN